MSYRIDPAGEPIGDDDASIARALEEASIPCLMMSMIHMSGDTTLLDGDLRPLMCFLNETPVRDVTRKARPKCAGWRSM